MQLEVVVTDVSEALEAEHSGASRLELVAEPERGGLTPPPELVENVTHAVSIPVCVMLRPHDDGFAYGEAERRELLETASRLQDLGAAGVVFGALDRSRHVAAGLVREVLAAAQLPMTFHRAIDHTTSLTGAYAALAGIEGVVRVLTAGGAANAWEGRARLRELGYGNTVPTVVAGGGIDPENLNDLVEYTRVREVHMYSGARTDGKIDGRKIRRVMKILEDYAVL
jgi:copper homeostasis protein